VLSNTETETAYLIHIVFIEMAVLVFNIIMRREISRS